MRIGGLDLRKGMVVEYNGNLCLVVNTTHRTPGNLRAFMQAELKDLRTGTKFNNRFNATDTIERIRLDEAQYQYLYQNGDMFVFMNQDNYEQVEIPTEQIGDDALYLQENMIVSMQMHEGVPVTIKLPQTVVLTVTETEPVVKGQTAASSAKPAILENGVKVMVPPFIVTGTRIVVNTEEGAYVERAKD